MRNGYDFLISHANISQLHMDFIRDLYSFMRERRKWWLTPVILLLIFVGLLVVIGGGSAVAPFIYTLF
jgi:hypothetical protein